MSDSFERYCAELDEVSVKVIRRLGHEVSDMLEEGMTSPQFLVMRLIGQNKAMTVSEISEHMGVTLSAVTSLSDRLKASGLLTRERDEADRRIVWLKLTDSGRQKLEELEAKRIAMMRKYLGRLPEDDLARMLDIFRRLAVIVDDMAPGSK